MKILKLNIENENILFTYEEVIKYIETNSNLRILFFELGISNIETGEQIDCRNLYKEYKDSLYELKIEASKLGIESSKSIDKKIDKIANKLRNEILSEKIKLDTITPEEYLEWCEINNKKIKLRPSFTEYKIFNNAKKKPDNLSVIDYGRFNILCSMTSYDNKLKHSNGKPYSEKTLLEILELKTKQALSNTLNRLIEFNMIAYIKSPSSKTMHIVINPAYMSSPTSIDTTIYELFKDDLDEVLDDETKKYLQLSSKYEKRDDFSVSKTTSLTHIDDLSNFYKKNFDFVNDFIQVNTINGDIANITNSTSNLTNNFGVYFLFDKNELVYIGKSINIENRIKQHIHDKEKKFCNVMLVEFNNISDIHTYEKIFIQKLQPKLNKILYKKISF